MVEKLKTKKNQQIFDNSNMWNNTIKITFYYITTRKATKGIKNIFNAVDLQGVANNYNRQIQGQKYFCQTQKNMRDNEFCDVTLSSVNGPKFKAHKVILLASSILFKKLLVNNLNHHLLIFMRKIKNEPFGLNESP